MINSVTLFFVARDQAGHGRGEEHCKHITHGARHWVIKSETNGARTLEVDISPRVARECHCGANRAFVARVFSNAPNLSRGRAGGRTRAPYRIGLCSGTRGVKGLRCKGRAL